ncbi:autotransporter outer membrane beta-barrel domain-containing protein [Pandoraea anhela]|nr:autotransporter outer membrane beta-barrel domain-containing protein [Pandoraea anhela]
MRAIPASILVALSTYAGSAKAIDISCAVIPINCLINIVTPQQANGSVITVRNNGRALISGLAGGETSPQYLHINIGGSVEASNLIFRGPGSDTPYGRGLVSVSDGSQMFMSNSRIEARPGDFSVGGAEAVGLWVFRRTRTEETNRPSVAHLENVDVSGVGRAVIITGASQLEMTGGSVTSTFATGPIGAAVQVTDSNFNTFGTKINGFYNGIVVTTDPMMSANEPFHSSRLILANSEITSGQSSAIRIDRQRLGHDDTRISVVLANDTKVNAGNGVILEAGFDQRYLKPFELDVAVDNSKLEGDFKFNTQVDSDLLLTNNAEVTGRIEGVKLLRLEDGGQWRLVEDTTATTVTMADGVIDIHGTATDGQYRTLDIGSLSGEGEFRMQTNLETGESDRLNLTNGDSTGNFRLAVKNVGTEALVPVEGLVYDAGGNAQFAIVGDKVDLGAYSYSLEKQQVDGQTVWQLVRDGGTSISTDTVMGVVGATPTVWLGEMTTLRARMGEMRLHEPKDGGVWARTFGNRYNAKPASGQGYRQDQWGVLFGADRAVAQTQNGTWYAGAMAGTSTSNLKFGVGSNGAIESYTVGGYATWIGKNGYYFDGVLKYNRYNAELNARMRDGVMSAGEYSNNGFGASAEFGRRLGFGNGWFVEPYAQVAAMTAGAADFSLDNGMVARSSRTTSIQTSLGATLGKTFETSKGTFQPYVRAAVIQDFAKNNKVTINGNEFNNDLSGTRVEVGAGLAAQMQKNLQAYLDASYSGGKRLDKPWGVNVGVRYTF